MSNLIRQVVSQDFDEVFPLFKQLWPTKPINSVSLRATFVCGVESDHDEFLCSVYDGQIVGFCAYAIVNNLWQEGQIAYIYAMVVDERYRGTGIGTELIKTVIQTARTRGLKRIELDSAFQREQAHTFYEHLGFEKRAFLFSYVLVED